MAPDVVVSGAMTGDEHVWLDGVAALHKAMDGAVPSTLTPESMRVLAGRLGGCTRTLDGLGAVTVRFRPVAEVARQACAEYERSGQCFATAADVGPFVVGSAEERQHEEATDCAFAGLSAGSRLFADAEMQGFDVEQASR